VPVLPIGTFLDSFPAALFISAHVAFIGAGLWSAARARPLSPLLALYVVSQLFFLAFFGGLITMKMAVLMEQTLLVAMVVGMGMTQKRRVVERIG
jgi:uncharacterized membrane protein YhhN